MVVVQSLTQESFKPYGDVIDVSLGNGVAANQGKYFTLSGTAKRVNKLTKLVNLRQRDSFGIPFELKNPPATENVCVFRVEPASLPFSVKLLERHQFSSQMFIPMTNQKASYLVVVALNDPATNKPDFSTIKAFLASSTQAFNYRPNIWHHPMIGLKNVIDFVCIVYERRADQNSSDEDTEEVFFPLKPIQCCIADSKL